VDVTVNVLGESAWSRRTDGQHRIKQRCRVDQEPPCSRRLFYLWMQAWQRGGGPNGFVHCLLPFIPRLSTELSRDAGAFIP